MRQAQWNEHNQLGIRVSIWRRENEDEYTNRSSTLCLFIKRKKRRSYIFNICLILIFSLLSAFPTSYHCATFLCSLFQSTEARLGHPSWTQWLESDWYSSCPKRIKKKSRNGIANLTSSPSMRHINQMCPMIFAFLNSANSAVCHFRNVFVFICMNWRKSRGPHYDLNSETEFGRRGEIEIFDRFCIVEFDQQRAISHCALRQFNEIFVSLPSPSYTPPLLLFLLL